MDTRKRLAAQSEVTMRKMNPNIIRKKSDNVQLQGSTQVSNFFSFYMTRPDRFMIYFFFLCVVRSNIFTWVQLPFKLIDKIDLR